MSRKLRVFLCHATEDKPAVRKLYASLKSFPWIDPWLDEENLLPGQDWDLEIYKAIRDADVIVVCFSNQSIAREGYIQKEIKRALNLAEEKPDGTIYIIPLRLDDCQPPIKFNQWQWVDYFDKNSNEKLIQAFKLRLKSLGLNTHYGTELELYKFIQIPHSEQVPYSFYIGKYPVTNVQYERFLNAPDYAEKKFWIDFPKYNGDCVQIGRWEQKGWDWVKKVGNRKPQIWVGDWHDSKDEWISSPSDPEYPVVGTSWYEANAYCNWLMFHWNNEAESRANLDLVPNLVRLPLEYEWSAAAGGEKPEDRYPWNSASNITKSVKDIITRANVNESRIGHTTPVTAYLRGASPYGVMDMAGNAWEWQANLKNNNSEEIALRGGSWADPHQCAHVSFHIGFVPEYHYRYSGFRVVCIPK